MAKKEVSPTVKAYKKWKVAAVGLTIGTFASPLLPATLMTAINWDEWFAKSGVSLPFGFSALVVSTVLSIVGIWKKDSLVNKTVSAVFYLSIVFMFFGVAFLFLANLMSQVGYMFLATAGGLAVGASADQVNRSLARPMVKEYRKLIDRNALDPNAKKKAERKKQAREDAENEEKERQATE